MSLTIANRNKQRFNFLKFVAFVNFLFDWFIPFTQCSIMKCADAWNLLMLDSLSPLQRTFQPHHDRSWSWPILVKSLVIIFLVFTYSKSRESGSSIEKTNRSTSFIAPARWSWTVKEFSAMMGKRHITEKRGRPGARHLGRWRSMVKWLICQQNPRQIFKGQELQDEAQGWECTRKKRNN